MVLEAEGELQPGDPQEEEKERAAKGVDVNPFWSQKVQDEAALRASRPSGLPPVPGTDEKLDEEGVLRGEPGRGGGLLGGHDQQIGSHPEADSSRADGGEFWSEVKRDLMADLEGAAVANGGDDLHPEDVRGPELDRDLRPEGGRRKGGNAAILHGVGGEPTRREEDRVKEKGR